MAGRNVESFAELSQVFPVQVIEPGVHKLVEEGASRRRRWMDWAVFHVEPLFVDTWLRYTRALRQRNAALRTEPDLAAAWDPEVARLGEEIALSRGRFIEQLQPFWRDTVAALSGLHVQLHYHRGWHADLTLADGLAASRPRDALRRCHSCRPAPRGRHRPAGRQGGARGALPRPAEAGGGGDDAGAAAPAARALRRHPTLLLDDPAAELDAEHLRSFHRAR